MTKVEMRYIIFFIFLCTTTSHAFLQEKIHCQSCSGKMEFEIAFVSDITSTTLKGEEFVGNGLTISRILAKFGYQCALFGNLVDTKLSQKAHFYIQEYGLLSFVERITPSKKELLHLSTTIDPFSVEKLSQELMLAKTIYLSASCFADSNSLNTLCQLAKKNNKFVIVDLQGSDPILFAEEAFTTKVNCIIVDRSMQQRKDLLQKWKSQSVITILTDSNTIWIWDQGSPSSLCLQSDNKQYFIAGFIHGLLQQKKREHCIWLGTFLAESINNNFSEQQWKKIRERIFLEESMVWKESINTEINLTPSN